MSVGDNLCGKLMIEFNISEGDKLCGRLYQKLNLLVGQKIVMDHMPLLMVCLEVCANNYFENRRIYIYEHNMYPIQF